MPMTSQSRYLFTTLFTDDAGRFYLSPRKSFPYRALPDNITHTVVDGDDVFNIAGQYLQNSLLYWVVMDFQPHPITDPTLALEAGQTIIVPSYRTVHEELFNELRRSERTF